MLELHATITGTVQKVHYRDFVQRAATDLGLVGYVENRHNGTVVVVAQGLPDDLKAFIECLHEGSVLAKVEDVSVSWRIAKMLYSDFSITYV
jgi:acylphosphatase